MQKIISLFQRNYDGDRKVRDEITPGAEWVNMGQGIATRKYDGTCCWIDPDHRLWKRYELKKGRTAPEGFIAAQDPDPITGDIPGWLPVGSGNEDRWHREAFKGNEEPGTYELVGPKINGNRDHFEHHILIMHGVTRLQDAPREYVALKKYLNNFDPPIEGIVWHHPDGRMVKIKKKDFPE